MIRKNFAITALAVAAALCAQQVTAQSAAALKTAVEKALSTNPEVTAKFHAFRAATDTVDISAATRGPRLDLTGDVGAERSTFTAGPRESLNRSGVTLNLTQVLWDGMGNRNELERASHERLSRYFELLDATELTAAEAARALYDVQRYRKLVALAEDSYVQHRQAADKIQSRVRAGVGRGVDLEQANARVALAESNLSSEVSNLHDVSARYQRIIGEVPPPDAGTLTVLDLGLPARAPDALQLALSRNPAISASIESLRAARAAVKTRSALLEPRVEARLRTGVGHNYNSLDGRRSDSAAEIVLNWNLFDGGADRARIRQQANVVNQAIDLRDKACRDTRQTTAIAYNDTVKLAEQLVYLDRNTQAIERARDAYRQQFDIGQRSLLDLLNAENEAYTARRALVNAQYDRAVAHVRTHAALNQLNAQLGIARGGHADEAVGWTAGDDAAGRCPVQAVEVAAVDAAALMRRQQAAPAPVPAPAPASSPAASRVPAIVPAPPPSATAAPMAMPVQVVPAPTPTAPTKAIPLGQALAQRVNGWADAWRSKDFDRYASFYAPGFTGTEPSNRAWESKRRRMLGKPGPIGLAVDQVATVEIGTGLAETRFQQAYTSSNYSDDSSKVLTWKLMDGRWLIVKESNR